MLLLTHCSAHCDYSLLTATHWLLLYFLLANHCYYALPLPNITTHCSITAYFCYSLLLLTARCYYSLLAATTHCSLLLLTARCYYSLLAATTHCSLLLLPAHCYYSMLTAVYSLITANTPYALLLLQTHCTAITPHPLPLLCSNLRSVQELAQQNESITLVLLTQLWSDTFWVLPACSAQNKCQTRKEQTCTIHLQLLRVGHLTFWGGQSVRSRNLIRCVPQGTPSCECGHLKDSL